MSPETDRDHNGLTIANELYKGAREKVDCKGSVGMAAVPCDLYPVT
jgi:hypothetical protein